MAKMKSKKKRPRTPSPSVSDIRLGAAAQGWFLEGKVAGSHGMTRIALDCFPFRVGRREDVELTLSTPSISGYHAEFYFSKATGKLGVRDLHSTNGTFVNHERVRNVPLKAGDLLHLADIEFKVRREAPDAPQRGKQTLQLGKGVVPSSHFADGAEQLLELIRSKSIVPLFQPIVRLPEREVDAYEVLTRGSHPDLTENPTQLLEIAARMGMAAELSRLFRNMALEAIGDRDDLPMLFLNTHPDELQENHLDFVVGLRELAPKQPLVLEIHETALADADSIRELQLVLSKHCIGLAFDDFGAGQARVVQLAEVPPDYLKFDRSFVSGIDTAAPSKRHVLSSIVATANDLGVSTVAEGIETEAEAEICTRIGFTHGQGYLFGRPITLARL